MLLTMYLPVKAAACCLPRVSSALSSVVRDMASGSTAQAGASATAGSSEPKHKDKSEGGEKKKKTRAKSTVRRPMSAYNLFMKESPNMQLPEDVPRMQALSHIWHQLTPEQRAPYEKEAAAQKQQRAAAREAARAAKKEAAGPLDGYRQYISDTMAAIRQQGGSPTLIDAMAAWGALSKEEKERLIQEARERREVWAAAKKKKPDEQL